MSLSALEVGVAATFSESYGETAGRLGSQHAGEGQAASVSTDSDGAGDHDPPKCDAEKRVKSGS